MEEIEEHPPSENLQQAIKKIKQSFSVVFIAEVAATFIVETVKSLKNISDQFEVIRQIDECFQRTKCDATDTKILEALDTLKTQIIHQCGTPGEYSNWKDALLGVHYLPISRTFLQEKSVYPDASKVISLADKKRFMTVERKNVSVISGSSFATNDQNDLNRARDENGQPKREHILDGSYTAFMEDGWFIAVGDGCGHRRDELENEDIGRTAYFAAKDACRLMACYFNADELKNNLNQLAEQISKDIIVKVRAHRNKSLEINPRDMEDRQRRTTLGCARAFAVEGGEWFRLVGFNVGDTTLIAYNPITKQFQTLAKARVMNRGFGGASPAALPDLYSPEEMVSFDVTLPRGSSVFGLTDGVWDYLPVKSVDGEITRIDPKSKIQNTKANRDKEIDFDALLLDDPNFKMPESINASTLNKAIADYAIFKTEEKRKQEPIQLQEGLKQAAALEERINALLAAGRRQGQDKELDNLILERKKLPDSSQITLGDDFTSVGLQLDNIDFNPDYTRAEKFLEKLRKLKRNPNFITPEKAGTQLEDKEQRLAELPASVEAFCNSVYCASNQNDDINRSIRQAMLRTLEGEFDSVEDVRTIFSDLKARNLQLIPYNSRQIAGIAMCGVSAALLLAVITFVFIVIFVPLPFIGVILGICFSLFVVSPASVGLFMLGADMLNEEEKASLEQWEPIDAIINILSDETLSVLKAINKPDVADPGMGDELPKLPQSYFPLVLSQPHVDSGGGEVFKAQTSTKKFNYRSWQDLKNKLVQAFNDTNVEVCLADSGHPNWNKYVRITFNEKARYGNCYLNLIDDLRNAGVIPFDRYYNRSISVDLDVYQEIDKKIEILNKYLENFSASGLVPDTNLSPKTQTPQ